MIIKVKKSEFFYKWLEWLNPLMPLNDTERKVLSTLIGLHYTHKKRYSEETIQQLLLSSDTQDHIAKTIGIPVVKIRNAFKSLTEKGILSDKGLNPVLIDYPKDNKFKININFELTD